MGISKSSLLKLAGGSRIDSMSFSGGDNVVRILQSKMTRLRARE